MPRKQRAHGEVRSVLLAVFKDEPEDGLQVRDVAERTGLSLSHAGSALHRALQVRDLVALNFPKQQGGRRYFTNQERLQAATHRLLEQMAGKAEAAVEHRREYMTQYKRQYRANAKAGAPKVESTKPAKAQDAWRANMLMDREVKLARKAAAPAGVHIPPAKVPKEVKIIYPAKVKVTIAPAPLDYRFHVDPSHRGEFSEEWQRLRGGGK